MSEDRREHSPNAETDDQFGRFLAAQLSDAMLPASRAPAGRADRPPIDVDQIVTVGARRVRLRRHFAAAGIAAGVAAVVIGGAVIGKQPQPAAQTSSGATLIACPSSSEPTPLPHGTESGAWGWDQTSSFLTVTVPADPTFAPTDEGSSAQSVPPVQPSAATRATAAAASAAQLARGATPAAPADSSWITEPKAIQLTLALRAGLPPTVEVPGYSDINHLIFDAPGYYTVVGPDPAGGETADIYPDTGPLPSFTSLTTGGTLMSGSRTGELGITVGHRTAAIPGCNDGTVDRRVTDSHGTIVDLHSTFNKGTLQAIDATAYRTDGSQISATLTRSDSGGPLPMSGSELAALVATDGLDTSTVPSTDDHRQALNKIITLRTGQPTATTHSTTR